MEKQINKYAECLVSILDSLKLYDKKELVLGEETLSKMMFRKMKAYNIDLNKECGWTHLKPIEYKKQKPKYKVGDKIRVCGDFETQIDRITLSIENNNQWIYHFKDKKGVTWWECEEAIELIKSK